MLIVHRMMLNNVCAPGGAIGGMFAQRAPGGYLCIKYFGSSPKFILTWGSPRRMWPGQANPPGQLAHNNKQINHCGKPMNYRMTQCKTPILQSINGSFCKEGCSISLLHGRLLYIFVQGGGLYIICARRTAPCFNMLARNSWRLLGACHCWENVQVTANPPIPI